MINNRERFEQLISFAGMNYKGGTPTDIDLFLEFDGKVFIFAEIKLKGVQCPEGQRRALNSLVCNLNKKYCAVAFIAEHQDYDFTKDIIAANARIVEYTYGTIWVKADNQIMLKEAIDIYLKSLGLEKYIN